MQRVTGSLRRTNFFLAITSYVLVLYASFLTRSGVLADFSVHSFVNLGLNGFLLSFLFLTDDRRLRRCADRAGATSLARTQPLGSFSRESMMWLGQLVFMLMCALTAVGMSAPLITRLFGPPSNVQTSYYNLVNAPLAIAMGLLLGIGAAHALAARRTQARSARARIARGAGGADRRDAGGGAGSARSDCRSAIAVRGPRSRSPRMRSSPRAASAPAGSHGVAYLGHTGAAVLLIRHHRLVELRALHAGAAPGWAREERRSATG